MSARIGLVARDHVYLLDPSHDRRRTAVRPFVRPSVRPPPTLTPPNEASLLRSPPSVPCRARRDNATGRAPPPSRPRSPGTKGILEFDFLYQPLPATGWSLINASGMRHLRSLTEGDEQCRDHPALYLKIAAKDMCFSTRQARPRGSPRSRELPANGLARLVAATLAGRF